MKRIITRYIPSLKINVVYKVGKNAQNNFELIDLADNNDLWFHVNKISSCHVIACFKNRTINPNNHEENPNYYDIDFDNLDKKQKQQIITQGALICKQFSRVKNQKNVEIIYTKIENICKTEIIGEVTAFKTKSIII